MLDIQYLRPATLAEALDLARGSASPVRWVCGGTDLIVKARSGRVGPGTWIDVSRLDELGALEERDEGASLWIGAAVTWARLYSSPVVRRTWPALHEACRVFGSAQIRALGTLGGNVANASPAADGVPPLVALGARVLLCGPLPEARRWVEVDAFATAPGRTVLAPGELIVGLSVPKVSHSTFLKLGPRVSLSIAKVSVAVALDLTGDLISRVRVGLGAVGPTVLRAPLTESLLLGQRPSPALYRAAAAQVMTEVTPISDYRSTADYRRAMCGVLLGRALGALCGDASTGQKEFEVELR